MLRDDSTPGISKWLYTTVFWSRLWFLTNIHRSIIQIRSDIRVFERILEDTRDDIDISQIFPSTYRSLGSSWPNVGETMSDCFFALAHNARGMTGASSPKPHGTGIRAVEGHMVLFKNMPTCRTCGVNKGRSVLDEEESVVYWISKGLSVCRNSGDSSRGASLPLQISK